MLNTYKAKRDFELTPEPKWNRKKASGYSFVIQKHAARRLHFDFRLELDGVLKSWAVPKGPSNDPKNKRLAVEVEDHPLDYAKFEGNIPQGHYGGGSVIVWDRGVWIPEGNPHKGLKEGKLVFRLEGERLRGTWTLVRSHNKQSGKNLWFLIKSKHEPIGRDEPAETETTSVVTGLDLDDVAEGAKANRTKGKVKVFIEPELCTLVDETPGGQ